MTDTISVKVYSDIHKKGKGEREQDFGTPRFALPLSPIFFFFLNLKMVAQETRSSSSSSGRPSRPQTKSQQHKRKQSGGQQQQQQQHHHHHKKSKQQHEGAALPSEMSSNVIRKKIRDTERLLKRVKKDFGGRWAGDKDE